MKIFQLKFKILLFLIGFVIISCGNDEKSESSDSEKDSDKVEQTSILKNDKENKDSKLSKKANSRIAIEEDDETSPESPEGNTAPIALDCDYFRKNPNTVLINNLDSTVDYMISCMTRIDGKLTIEEGVVIAFDQDAGMYFTDKSTFKMQGTAEKPIILTGKEQTKGFWNGVLSKSSSSNNKMSHVTIDYAGGSKAALEIDNEDSSLKLEHCTLSNSKNYGMIVHDNVGKDVHNIFMENCTFTKNKIPFKTDASRLRLFNGTNSFSGNDEDYIDLNGGTVYGDATWANLNVPYFLQSDFRYRDGVLTVEAGTEIVMPAQSWMHLQDKASLVMVGTEEDPIIIRGEHDVPGFWNQLTIDSSSPLNEIGHVVFKNAGQTTKKPNGAVFLKRSKYLKIHDVVFSKCFAYGVSIQDLNKSHLEYANLKLDNTSKLFSDWRGQEISVPDNLQ
ncbi:MAG: hypothetical protein ACTHYV_05920 [Psychroflexus sp.]|uniref:hypothetical protein n=1 Tax=Psychroflexus sp. S27 TaxID=1982757 RepID=UPI000C2A9EEA|nr:hypothetical protein [Psychroflexus sp. S27]PJX22825.1 hypothetical protein CAP47_07315 [Psychroflexus sp. S27]